MEDVLDLYRRPHDPLHPVICLDEFSLQLIGDTVEPLPAQPGKLRKEDYEYVRKGTSSVFVIVEPLAGKRWAEVTGRRRKDEFVEIIRKISEEWYPEDRFDTISLVMDNLNTHKLSSLYEFLSPERARNIVRRIDVHYTPVHASWLNMAEIEIGALMTQSLRRRIDSTDLLIKELSACVAERNAQCKKIHWEFTCSKAREKLGRHYPSLKSRETAK